MLSPSFWKKYFSVYDVLNESPSYRKMHEAAIKALEPKPGQNILDVGVGTGNLAIKISDSGAHVVGVDFSPVALEIYKRKYPEAVTHEADITQGLPFFGDNSFDSAVSVNTLYNIPRGERAKIILEIRRVLKPGGKVVLINIHRGFKPIAIYIDTVKMTREEKGLLGALSLVFSQLWPTIKIFYYNYFIQKEYTFDSKNLFEAGEQRRLLKEAGFRNVAETEASYSGQAFLDSGIK